MKSLYPSSVESKLIVKPIVTWLSEQKFLYRITVPVSISPSLHFPLYCSILLPGYIKTILLALFLYSRGLAPPLAGSWPQCSGDFDHTKWMLILLCLLNSIFPLRNLSKDLLNILLLPWESHLSIHPIVQVTVKV